MENNTEIIITPDIEQLPINDKKEFKGYSMEELRYQRAMLLLRKEFCKSKILREVDQLKERSIFGRLKGESKSSRFGSLASKLLSGLNYLDYAMVGASLFGTGKKVYKFFRHKK